MRRVERGAKTGRERQRKNERGRIRKKWKN